MHPRHLLFALALAACGSAACNPADPGYQPLDAAPKDTAAAAKPGDGGSPDAAPADGAVPADQAPPSDQAVSGDASAITDLSVKTD